MTLDLQQDTGIEIDLTVDAGPWPPAEELRRLAAGAVKAVVAELDIAASPSELGIVFADDAHVRSLNARWRGKDGPTNVLSFPAFPNPVPGRLPPMLGDVVLAAETVASEAKSEGRPLADHVAHLIVHGVLHLIGYDHETEAEAEQMEDLERRVLARMGLPNPYW